MATSSKPASWSALSWRRRLETFGHNDASVLASGPSDGSMDNVCNLGELTDQGRYTTLTLGERLRHLYVEQLGFMPKILESADSVYLRATPMPRALESVQQAFWGMYPLSARTASFPPATIVTRTPQDETLFPNDANCRRFGQLLRAFGARTAERWNDTPDMEYLSSKISKWMPDQAPVRVDSHPRLSGIMDTVNSTLAHGPETRLPKEFYDDRAREIIETIGVEEWFSGYKESNEYRTVGIGALAGDIVARMVGSVEHSGNDGLLEVGGRDGEMGQGRAGEKGIRFGLSGCHDTTLAALLSSLGAFEGEKWPPYTSSIAFELFKKEGGGGGVGVGNVELDRPMTAMRSGEQRESGWLTWFGSAGKKKVGSEGIARKNIEEMNQGEREALGGFFVRVRYNDRAVTIPGCKTYGRHLEGDETFCTLVGSFLSFCSSEKAP